MKRYDRAYYDRWYHGARSRVRTGSELRRQVGLVVSVAEYVLERPIRTVLDVGCGEGAWQPVLRRLRPGVRYRGIDSSRYVVRRFGARRHIEHGSLAGLDEQVGREGVDVILCADVLHYVSAREMEQGLAAVRVRLGGVAYLPVFTSADGFWGDGVGWYRRAPSYYRRLFARMGLVPCGLHCYAAGPTMARLAVLERVGNETCEGGRIEE
jgi:predicted TPR repeat methyltransferase